MRKSTSTEIIYKIVGFLFLLLAWQLLAMAVGEREFIFPGPRESFARAWEMLQGEYVYRCILETFKRMLCGFAISLLLALLLGIPAGNHEEFRLFLSPSITTLKAIPTASLVYLFLVLSGARNTPLYIVVLISFPILYESVIGGIRSLPESLNKALMIDGGSELHNTLKVKLPLAIPYILVGVASSFTLSFKIEIMAEVITGYSRMGLGSAIMAAQRSDPTNMTEVFGYSLVAVALMLLIDLLMSLFKKRILANRL